MKCESTSETRPKILVFVVACLSFGRKNADHNHVLRLLAVNRLAMKCGLITVCWLFGKMRWLEML